MTRAHIAGALIGAVIAAFAVWLTAWGRRP
jgi:hypothetical protein